MKSALPYQQAMRRSVAAIVVANLMWCGAPPAFASEAASTVSGADEEVTITSGSKRTVFEYRPVGR